VLNNPFPPALSSFSSDEQYTKCAYGSLLETSDKKEEEMGLKIDEKRSLLSKSKERT
jgi:hypothetical protein